MDERRISKLNKFEMVRYLSNRALAAFGDPLEELKRRAAAKNTVPLAPKKRSTKRKSSGKRAKRHV